MAEWGLPQWMMFLWIGFLLLEGWVYHNKFRPPQDLYTVALRVVVFAFLLERGGFW